MPRLRIVREALPTSGLSYWNGREWIIALSDSDSLARQRHTLLHEFKHIIDHGAAGRLYRSQWEAERAADYFAACALMPKPELKRVFCTITQSLTALAQHFGVSQTAIRVRLEQTGLVDPASFTRQRCARPVSTPLARRAALCASRDEESGVTAEARAETKTAVLYLRVSTKEQATKGGEKEGFSIPAQRESCRRKAEALGATVLGEYVDAGESARSANRPELQRMLRDLRGRSADYLIVHKVDRLARNRMDDLEIHSDLPAASVTLVSCSENIDETPSGMLLHGIMSSIAEFYSRNLAAEVSKGMGQKASVGGTPGRAPIGYRNAAVQGPDGRETRGVVFDDQRAPHIRWAFEQYATGQWTLASLASELVQRGLTTVPSPKRPAKPVRFTQLHMILTNRYYLGEVSWRGAIYEGKHEPLVSGQAFEAVQAVLESHRNGERQREHTHYLKSTVFCGDCGERMIVTHATNRYGTVYPYFVCLGRHQERHRCERQAVLISTLETLVEELYERIQIRPEHRAAIQEAVHGHLATFTQEAEQDARRLARDRHRLLDGRTKLLQAHYAGAVPLDQLKEEQARIGSRLRVVEEQEQVARSRTGDLDAALAKALDRLEHCHDAYLRASDHERRLLNQGLFTRIWVHRDYTEAELAEPFNLLIHPDLLRLLTGEGEMTPLATNPREARSRQAEPVEARSTSKMNKPSPGGEGLNTATLVRERGVEPPRPFGHTDLNRARLPFRHSRVSPQGDPEETSTAAGVRLTTGAARSPRPGL